LPPRPVICNIENREEENEESPPLCGRSPLQRGPPELDAARAPPSHRRRLRQRSATQREARQRPQEIAFSDPACRCPDIVTPSKGGTMGILGWILFGLVVGIVAKLLMPGKDPGGFIVTILLGIVGALLGGYLGRVLGLYQPGEPAGFIGATLGAILVLWIYRMAMRRRTAV
jgi:uncharacterized membrane protein YeaQ/YmgE (transglycosylase-associated protein family)